MSKVTKWILKSKNNSLEPGEEVLVALGVSAQNKVRNMAVGELAGLTAGEAVGGVVAEVQEKKKRKEHPSSLLDKYPTGPVIIALTPKRMLVFKLNFLGRPKALAASYDKSEITKVGQENKGINYTLTISFKDGGTVTNDVSKMQGNDLKQFIDLINKA